MNSSDTVPNNLAPRKRRRDHRLATLLSVVAVVAALGYGVSLLPSRGIQTIDSKGRPPDAHPPMGFSTLTESSDVSESTSVELAVDPRDPNGDQARQIFNDANQRIKNRLYDEAIGILHAERPLLQKYAESYLLLGRALEGKKEYDTARAFYKAAIERNPYMPDAYWGFATTSEQLQDLESALGAMRSFLHTEPVTAQNRLKIAQARSALWEMEAKLGRGPWGPTKGVPPGFTVEQLRRDSKAPNIKMPIGSIEGANSQITNESISEKKVEIVKR
jgi:hypothetical protein